MRLRVFALILCVTGGPVALSGCTAFENAEPANATDYTFGRNTKVKNPPWMQDQGTIFSGENSLLSNLRSGGDSENTLPVNKYLWRGALDTLSFLPIASIDTFSGVISTDWTTAQGVANERSRVTVYVRDAELSASALDVSTFRETLAPGGVWQSVPADPNVAVQLEDAILNKARQLRIRDVDG